jgi:hypothetical protein
MLVNFGKFFIARGDGQQSASRNNGAYRPAQNVGVEASAGAASVISRFAEGVGATPGMKTMRDASVRMALALGERDDPPGSAFLRSVPGNGALIQPRIGRDGRIPSLEF